MIFFLESIETLIRRLDRKYEKFLNIGGYLNERQQQVLEFIRKKGVIHISDLKEVFPDVSLSTLKRDLSLLGSESLIERTGRGRSTAYRVQ